MNINKHKKLLKKNKNILFYKNFKCFLLFVNFYGEGENIYFFLSPEK